MDSNMNDDVNLKEKQLKELTEKKLLEIEQQFKNIRNNFVQHTLYEVIRIITIIKVKI